VAGGVIRFKIVGGLVAERQMLARGFANPVANLKTLNPAASSSVSTKAVAALFNGAQCRGSAPQGSRHRNLSCRWGIATVG
jgi:hypothetical protein